MFLRAKFRSLFILDMNIKLETPGSAQCISLFLLAVKYKMCLRYRKCGCILLFLSFRSKRTNFVSISKLVHFPISKLSKRCTKIPNIDMTISTGKTVVPWKYLSLTPRVLLESVYISMYSKQLFTQIIRT